MELIDKLNENSLADTYRMIIQTGTAKLLEYPERKEGVTNDWREENGKEYDLGLVRYKEKTVVLSCAFLADDDEEFWQNYNAFFEELTQSGWQNLYIADHDKTYEISYKKTSNFEKRSKRLRNVDLVFVKFRLTLIINQ